MLNVRLAGDHLNGKLLFTWLSLVVSVMVSFCGVLFPTRCLGWDLELIWVSFWAFSFLLLPLTYNAQYWKFAFIVMALQIFWQNVYRNGVREVVHQPDKIYVNCIIWLVAMATKWFNIEKYSKIDSSKTYRPLKFKLNRKDLSTTI